MTLRECFEFLRAEGEKYAASRPPFTAQQLIALESKLRERVDAHARKICGLGTAPELTEDDQYFLAQRIHFATILILSFDAPGSPLYDPDDWDWSDHLYWLLSDSWHRAGHIQWETMELVRDADVTDRNRHREN